MLFSIRKIVARFEIKPLSPTDVVAINKIMEKWYTNQLVQSRLEMYGSAALKGPRPGSVPPTQPMKAKVQTRLSFGGRQASDPLLLIRAGQHPEWFRELNLNGRTRLLDQYHKLQWVQYHLVEDHSLYLPRQAWESVFTACCKLTPQCLECRDCRKRFAQATIVLVSAQGTRDLLIVPHLGAVFRHPRYLHFLIEEWASVSLAELTICLSQTSKQAQTGQTVSLFLRDFANQLSFFRQISNHPLPTTVGELTCYHGFGKKSACLLLGALGMGELGIAVDRHLMEGFKNLNWVSSTVREETAASEMVEMWLPKHNKKYQPILLQTAERLGMGHRELVEWLCAETKKQNKKEKKAQSKKKAG
jgi:hypothetical protein